MSHILLYLDPGNGAIIAQVLAGIAGFYYVIKTYAIGFFTRRKKSDDEPK